MAKASDNVFPRVIYGMNTTDQAAPADSSWRVYSKAGGIYARSSNSVVGPFGTSGAGTTVATDTIWDTAGDLVIATGADAAVKWVPGSASYKRSTGDYTTTSTTFTDVDGTNLALTFTTKAHRCLVTFTGTITASGAAGVFLEVSVDGTAIGGGTGGLVGISVAAGTPAMNGSFSVITDVLSAASHTFKLRWRTSAGTAQINADGTVYTARFTVAELVNA